MRKFVTRSILLLTLLGFGWSQVASAGGPMPPGSHAFGRSLSGWMSSYWASLLSGERQPGSVGKVVFMPLPEDFNGERDVTLRPGEKFVMPMLAFNGDLYEDGTEDDPDGFPATIFTGADVMLMMDGKVVLDSEFEDLNDYFFEIFYAEPIVFPEPIPRPDGRVAVAAPWVKGIGFAYPPLSRGEHTMELLVYVPDFDFGFLNTWNITVD